MKNLNYFDQTELYNTKISFLVHELISECNRAKIPVFVSVCTKNDESGTTYKNNMVSAVLSNIKLTDDKFVKFVNVINGFDTVPKADLDTFDFEFDD